MPPLHKLRLIYSIGCILAKVFADHDDRGDYLAIIFPLGDDYKITDCEGFIIGTVMIYRT